MTILIVLLCTSPHPNWLWAVGAVGSFVHIAWQLNVVAVITNPKKETKDEETKLEEKDDPQA